MISLNRIWPITFIFLLAVSGIVFWYCRSECLFKTNFYTYSATLSPDGRWLATGEENGIVEVWDMKNMQRWTTVKAHRDVVTSVVFSSDGNMLATGSADTEIHLWKFPTMESYVTIKGHDSQINSLSFCANQNILVSASGDRSVAFWDTSGNLVHRLLTAPYIPSCIAFNSREATLAVGFNEPPFRPDCILPLIRLYNVATKKEIASFEGHKLGISVIAFDPAGKILVSGTANKSRHSNLEIGAEVVIWDCTTKAPLKVLRKQEGSIKSLTFHQKGETIAVLSSDNSLEIFGLENFCPLCIYQASESPNFAFFHLNDNLLIVGSRTISLRKLCPLSLPKTPSECFEDKRTP